MLSLSTEEIEYQRAHLKEDKRAMIIGPSVVFLVAAYIAVILRFASRRIARTAYKQDDWWILGGLVELGGFVSITSIVRLFFVRKVGSRDPTIDDVDGATISAAECCVGIISACLPTYRPLYIRYRHGRIEARDTRATPKAYGNKSTESKHLKSLRSKSAADSNKGYSREYGGLYKQLGNKTDVEYQSDERQMMGTSDNIFVTKTFASSNSRFGGNFGEL
ncbi:MAG: hypothetical protein Q9190_000782 [Brigantiaea leucoxantha]